MSKMRPKRILNTSELMTEMNVKWQKVKLCDLCSSISDGDHLAPPKSDTGVPFVTISDIRDNHFDLSDTRFVPEAYYQKIDEKRKVHKGDVLYSVVGSYGIPVFAASDLKIAFQRHIAILRPGEKLVPKFLYYSLKNPTFYKKADGAAIGAAQKTISLSALRRLEIDIPPLPTQKRIADILSAYDDLIENNRRRMEILEESARLIFKERFEDVWERGKLPRGWRACYVPDCIEVEPEVANPHCDEIRYIPMAALSTAGMTIDVTKAELRTKATSARFVNGDVLLAGITPCLENGKTGLVNFLEENEVACGSTEFIVLRGRTVSPYFTYCLSRTDRFRETAIKSMVGASGRQRVQPECFDTYEIALPTAPILREFDELVEPMFEQIGLLVKQNQDLAEARDMLLPKLMTQT